LVTPVGGSVRFRGEDITGLDPVATAQLGIAQVPGGRGVFPSLTVAENLRVAGWLARHDRELVARGIDQVLDYFPILRTRWDTPAGSLSGGEQQMLSLGQAFITRPQLLLIDELSLGLSPVVVSQLLGIVRAIHERGTTIVLVEQSVNTALKLAERAAFMEKGEVRFSGPTADLLGRTDILRAVFLKGGVPAAAEDNGSERSAVTQRVVLETRGLTKRYGGIAAVQDVDLTVLDGEMLGLIGPNGAGKTTLFDLITGLVEPDAGRISYRREAIAVALERHVAEPAALPALFGLPAVADSEARVSVRVEELIDVLGLGAFRDKFVAELSTGSRRIVEIGCMLAHGPRVLLLDEPSSGIAQKETEALGPVLRDVRRQLGCALLVIEHDMGLITGLADRLVALELGAVIAEGAPEEVIGHPRVVTSYLGEMADEVVGAGGKRS
jgi:branched-chain amino acid transport system ATP-binding protein